jgi:protein-S-isoprenylcysteine O-methyltransferase Ste14
MKRLLSIAYALVAYMAFLGSFGALVLAATGVWPAMIQAVDAPPHLAASLAVAIDLGLVLAFGVQHSVMARPGFKRLLTRVVPLHLERSTFVLVSAICAGAIAYCWAPIAGDLWVTEGKIAVVVQALAFAGFGLAVLASYAFDHFELFGLKQVSDRPEFRVPALYRVVRHPMMLGILVGVWAAPHMTIGHVVFAASMTAYIVIGVHFEERGLQRDFGQRYATYRAEVPMLLPWPRPSVRSVAVVDTRGA